MITHTHLLWHICLLQLCRWIFRKKRTRWFNKIIELINKITRKIAFGFNRYFILVLKRTNQWINQQTTSGEWKKPLWRLVCVCVCVYLNTCTTPFNIWSFVWPSYFHRICIEMKLLCFSGLLVSCCVCVDGECVCMCVLVWVCLMDSEMSNWMCEQGKSIRLFD